MSKYRNHKLILIFKHLLLSLRATNALLLWRKVNIENHRVFLIPPFVVNSLSVYVLP